MSDQNKSEDSPVSSEVALAAGFLERVRGFVAQLDPADRRLFASLIAPGLATAFDSDEEVAGFDSRWVPEPLPANLVVALRRRPLDLGPDDSGGRG